MAKELKPAFSLDAFNKEADTLTSESGTNKDTDSLLKQIEKYQIKIADDIPPPKIAIKVNDEILGTLGNFSMLTGKAKSRKSFCLSLFAGALIKKGSLYEQFTGCLPADKRTVLYFDTEQSRYHVQLAAKRICRLADVPQPENLKVYGLRSEPPERRLKMIEAAVENTPNLGFVFIDGIKDLVTSINDEEQATMIGAKLLKWSETQDVHIMVVLHQNKGDNNARGHIGTELLNKAETVLSVSKAPKDKDVSIVEPTQTRNKEPETYAFEILDGLPVLIDDFQIRTESKKNKFDVSDIEDHTLFALFNTAFSYAQHNEIGYTELVRQVKIAFKRKFNNKLGDNRAKEIISIGKNNRWIIQDKPKAPYRLGEFDDDDEGCF